MPDEKDKAQAELKACEIKPGQIFRHYKGGLYVVVAVSLNESNLEPMVTYHSNLKGSTWTRTLKNFTEIVTVPCDDTYGRSTVQIIRFSRMKD